VANFGDAVQALKNGKKTARSKWNNRNTWVILTKIYTHTLIEQGGVNTNYLPFITLKTKDEEFMPWVATQCDILAEDWEILE